MNNIPTNLTSVFLLPLLGYSRKMYEPYLVNAYLSHVGLGHWEEGCVFILLKFKGDIFFDRLEKVILSSVNYITDYEPDRNGEFKIYVMDIPLNYKKDYDLFVEGKYSKMSKASKDIILKDCAKGGTTEMILERHPKLVGYITEKIGQPLEGEAEVWSSVQDPNIRKDEVITDEFLQKLYKVKITPNEQF